MIDTLFIRATVVTMNEDREIIEDAGIAVANGRIVKIGPTVEMLKEFDADKIINAEGKIIFPGLINTHTHSFQTLLKGLEADTTLDDWLANVITPSVTNISEEDLYYAAQLSAVDAIQSGTTTILDYQYAQTQDGLNDAAIKGYRDTGMRLVYGRGFADTGVVFGANPNELEPLGKIKRETEELINTYHKTEDGMVHIALAPSAIWMCSPECMSWASECSDEYDVIVTAHTAETDYDNECSSELHGAGDFGALEKYNLLGERMLMVHCVQLTEEEVKKAGETGTRFSYNPVSNMYLASGAAPVGLMRKHGVVGSLGTDGAASNNNNDLLETLKSGILLAKAATRNPGAMTAMEALEYATCQGAKALGMDKEIGSLEAGKRADLFLFDPARTAKASACHVPVSTLAYSSDARNVELVMINGELVLQDGRMVKVSEEQVIEAGTRKAKELVKRIGL